MKKTFPLSIFFIICISQKSIAQIDTTKINRYTVSYFLSSQDSIRVNQALGFIADSASVTDPFALMIASKILYENGYKDIAVYWFYLGDIRARYSTKLYKDPSAQWLYTRTHVLAIQTIKPYAKDSIKIFLTRINQALEYDKLNPFDASEFMENPGDTTKFIPREQWQQQYDKSRGLYRKLAQDILEKGSAVFEDH